MMLQDIFLTTGNQLRCHLTMTGNANDAGFLNWNAVVTQMDELMFQHDAAYQGGSAGVGYGIGFYELTNDWQTIFVSASPTAPYTGDGSPGEYGPLGEYGTPGEYGPVVTSPGEYALLVLTFDAKYTTNGTNHTVQIRVTMDDSLFVNQDIAGSTTYHAGYRLADNITDNSASLSITPPTITVADSLTSGNDF